LASAAKRELWENKMSQIAISCRDLDPGVSTVGADSRRRSQSLVEAAFVLAAVAVLGSYALLAIGHARDRYQVGAPPGVYAGLAMSLNQGVFYPELYDGSRYAGTRYMPLHFVLHAGLARLTGEYLASGKLLTYGLTLALFAQLFCVLRGLRCGVPAALALPSVVVLTWPGLLACTTIRGDLLPAVIQLGALQVVAGGTSWRRAVLAALLCTLALLSKLNAGWAGLAIAWYYFGRQRRLGFVLAAAWALSAAGSVLALDWLSQGRMLANLRALAAPGLFRLGAVLAPLTFLFRVGQSGAVLSLVVPLAVVECVQAFRQRRTTVYHLALPCCVLTTMPIFLDKGVVGNHLIDLVVLCVPLLGCLWAGLPEVSGARLDLRLPLALLLVWGLFLAWATTLVGPCLEVVRSHQDGSAAGHYPARPLATLIGPDEPILSSDPWLSIARGHLPVVLDPCSLARFCHTRPELTEPLRVRIRRQEFRWVVLENSLDDPGQLAWADLSLGGTIVQAVRDSYQLHSQGKGYFVYAPRPREARAAAD
jgi:hypothetical protein